MRKRSKKRICAVALALAGISLAGVFLFRKNVAPAVIAISESTVKSMTTVAVNQAIFDTLGDPVRYDDLVSVVRDGEGNVLALVADAQKINGIARDAAYFSQENLTASGEAGVRVPIGTLTGSPVLAGFGPSVRIKIIPIGNVRCSFRSEFESAGINQTRHAIYLDVVAEIDLVIPTARTTVQSTTEILICDSLLAGKVPETYFGADFFGGKYDFVPN